MDGELVPNWRRLTSVAGVATAVAAAGAGAVIAAEKIAVGRIRLRPDPAAGEPFGQVRGEPVEVLADDGVRLYAEVLGPSEAPVTIVLCHGFCLNQDTWHYQRLGLQHHARVVAYDQRSHGRSGRSDPGQISIDQLGADLAAVLRATVPGDGQVVLAGHSMGGMTIMALAAEHPELFGSKIIGVALIATSSHMTDAAPFLARPLAQWAAPVLLRGTSRGPGAALAERVRDAGGDLAFLVTRYMAFGDPDVGPAVVDFLERVIRATPIDVVADFYRALLAHDKRIALPTVGQVPVTVIAGEQDRLIPVSRAASLAQAVPGARLVRVPGAGHVVILERPDLVTKEIAALAAQAGSNRPAQ